MQVIKRLFLSLILFFQIRCSGSFVITLKFSVCPIILSKARKNHWLSEYFKRFYFIFLSSKTNVGQASIEHLILNMGNTSFTKTILPLLVNFCDHFPKLKLLSLKSIKSTFYVSLYWEITPKRTPFTEDKFVIWKRICWNVRWYHIIQESSQTLVFGIDCQFIERIRSFWEWGNFIIFIWNFLF